MGNLTFCFHPDSCRINNSLRWIHPFWVVWHLEGLQFLLTIKTDNNSEQWQKHLSNSHMCINTHLRISEIGQMYTHTQIRPHNAKSKLQGQISTYHTWVLYLRNLAPTQIIFIPLTLRGHVSHFKQKRVVKKKHMNSTLNTYLKPCISDLKKGRIPYIRNHRFMNIIIAYETINCDIDIILWILCADR